MDSASFVQKPDFIRLADIYTPLLDEEGKGLSYAVFYERKLTNMQQAEFIVPILGLQGAGKSSMLNALLMDELILPVDADETTCIPVEIRYSRELNGQFIVHFKSDRLVENIATLAELEKYVHNNYNPGNHKGVSHIVVYKDNPALASGLVLVDLPGVGSLTTENVQTTMNYIERLAAAIFLIRTVPPITKTERIFLTAVWPKLTTAWFVQNQWDDESEAEVAEGKEHNTNVLRSIATKHRTSGDLDVMVINVYQALHGRLKNECELMDHSGLSTLWSKIQLFADSWQALLNNSFRDSVQAKLVEIREVINKRQEELTLSDSELHQRHQNEEAAYRKKKDLNDKRIAEIEDKIDKYEQELKKYAKEESQKQMENLRSEMRRVIGSGVVDGPLLNRAYQDNQKSIVEEMAENLSQKLFEIQQNLTVDLEDLEVRDAREEFMKYGTFVKAQSFKVEKGIPFICGVGGGLAGLKAGMAVGAAGGPVGIIMGGLAGIAVGFICSWVGDKAKNTISESRQTTTIRDLENPLQQFSKSIKSHIEDETKRTFNDIKICLEEFSNSQKQELVRIYKDNEKYRREQEDDIVGKEQRLKDDASVLARLEAELAC